MKCLEKDRTRRYETANGLAADIQRHLHDEPVTAGPPGAAYKLGSSSGATAAWWSPAASSPRRSCSASWARRRAWSARSTRRSAPTAKRRRRSAPPSRKPRRRTRRSGTNATPSPRRRAPKPRRRRRKSARKRAEAISEFVITALQAGDAVNPGGGQDMTILAAMDRAIADIDSGRFKDDPETEAGLRARSARSSATTGACGKPRRSSRKRWRANGGWARATAQPLRFHEQPGVGAQELGRKEEARLLLAEALEMNQRLFPGDHERGDGPEKPRSVAPEESEPLRRQALEMRRRLFRGDSDAVARDLMNLANGLQELGRTAEAEPLYAEAKEMGRRIQGRPPIHGQRLGQPRQVAVRAGSPDGRRGAAHRGARHAAAALQASAPGPREGIHNLAWAFKEQGRLSEAESLFVEALEMRPVRQGDIGCGAPPLLPRGHPAGAGPPRGGRTALHPGAGHAAAARAGRQIRGGRQPDRTRRLAPRPEPSVRRPSCSGSRRWR